MSEGYTKLFSDIVDSSIWSEDSDTCKVWVTLLAMSNASGFVRGSVGWLAGKSRVGTVKCQEALEKFSKPDLQSRTTDNDGRRIEILADGWLILNYLLFRDRLSSDSVSVGTRTRVRRHRLKHAGLNPDDAFCSYCGGEATGPDHVLPLCIGGQDTPDNRVPCCPRCNNVKNKRPLVVFLNDVFSKFIDIKRVASNPKLSKYVRHTGNAWENVTGVTGVTGPLHHVTPGVTASASASESSSVPGIKEDARNHQGSEPWEPTREWAMQWLAKSNASGSDYSEKETVSAFLALQANGWMWGRNPVTDHRAALERQIQTDRNKNDKHAGNRPQTPSERRNSQMYE